MKTLLKNKKIFSTLVLSCFIFFLIIPLTVKAIEFTPQIKIPGINYSDVKPEGSTKAIGEYIKGVYNYGIGIVAILATVVMMFGGFQWIIAGGSAEKVGEAKAWIGASLTGLVLALSSYTILNLINPNLTSLTVRKIGTVAEIEKANVIKKDFLSSVDNTLELAEIECASICKTNDLIKSLSLSPKSPECKEGSTCEFECSCYSSICEKKNLSWGDPCSIAGYDEPELDDVGVCYYGSCWSGPSKLNNPCGDNYGSKCVLSVNCSNQDVWNSGLKCENQYVCCEASGIK